MIIRIKYSKNERGRFLSHLDLLRTMERAFRRAALPLAFSQGFNPHPKISFGSALAVGVTSEGEYLDVELEKEMPLEEIKERLKGSMPSGLDVLDIGIIDGKGKSLTALINLAKYRMEITFQRALSFEEVQNIIKEINNSDVLMVDRAGKKGLRQVNIKEGIFFVQGTVEDDCLVLEADLRTGSQGNVRPEELIKIIEEIGGVIHRGNFLIHRLGLFVSVDGKVKSPMEVC